jgi:metal-responsive CopG/Arc/MetJ family transcriptional regulator
MLKRTTVMLEEDLYKKLVEESIRRYGSTRKISKVINELLRDAISGKKEITTLIRARKLAKVSSKEFEEFRRELSKRFEG